MVPVYIAICSVLLFNQTCHVLHIYREIESSNIYRKESSIGKLLKHNERHCGTEESSVVSRRNLFRSKLNQ